MSALLLFQDSAQDPNVYVLNLRWSLDYVSLDVLSFLCSLGWPNTSYVALAGLELPM